MWTRGCSDLKVNAWDCQTPKWNPTLGEKLRTEEALMRLYSWVQEIKRGAGSLSQDCFLRDLNCSRSNENAPLFWPYRKSTSRFLQINTEIRF